MNTPNWLTEALRRTDVTDICLNGPEDVFIDCGNGMQPLRNSGLDNLPTSSSTANEKNSRWSQEDLKSWVLEQISMAGKTWDARFPFIDATLPTGHRLHVAFPPLARQGVLVSLRRLPQAKNFNLNEPSRWAKSPLYERLSQAVIQGDSILISGATGSGKTTLATDLLRQVPSSERILALEDTAELSPYHPHFISMISRPPNADGFGEVTLRTLLRQALRMRPDRIILGECRGPEVLDLLQALNTGHRGSMATLHANSPRDALRRIELLCLLPGSGSVPLSAIRELLVVGVQWIVQVARVPITNEPLEPGQGTHSSGMVQTERKITELWKVDGREGDTILLRPILK